MMDFCILGSGIAGSTTANLLSKNYTVEVFDKARGPGGRTSNKRFKSNLCFDHGAQYISPKNREFKKFIQKLYKKNILKKWDGNHLDFTFQKKENTLKYIGKKANNDISKYLLKNIKQNYLSEIINIKYEKKCWKVTLKNKKNYFFKSLIITCPYPQLKKIAKKYLSKKLLNLSLKMEPNITAMLALKNNNKVAINSMRFNDDVIAWLVNENSKKRFKSPINLWTVQTNLTYSRKKINKYKEKRNFYLNQIINRFIKLTGFKKSNIIYKNIHGWKFAYNFKSQNIKSYWNVKYKLGFCGDWLQGPKVENAWVSATDLSNKIKKNPLIS